MTEKFDPLLAFASGSSASANYIWDGVKWIPQTASSGGGGGDVNITNSSLPVTIASMPTTSVVGTFFQATQPVSISGTVPVSFTNTALTDTQLRASAVPVNFTNSTLAVTGTFWQATQPVSIATMPSTPVTGTFWQVTQPISGSVIVSSAPTTAVTGTFWQGTQPVSIASMPTTTVTGTVTTQLAARTNLIGQATTITSSTSPATVVSAVAAVYCDIAHIDITNSSATATLVTLSDGTKSYIFSVPANGGITQNYNPALPATTQNVAWTCTCGTSVASIYVNTVITKV